MTFGRKEDEYRTVGTAGTYYVMAQLAAQRLHASATSGNAPFIDVLVASPDGSKSAALQVKTSRFAQRWKGRGEKVLHHYEWDLGHKVKDVPASDCFFYVFVDLRIEYWNGAGADLLRRPDIFVIPLKAVRKWYLAYSAQAPRSRLWVLPDFLDPYKEAYNLIHEVIGEKRPNQSLQRNAGTGPASSVEASPSDRASSFEKTACAQSPHG